MSDAAATVAAVAVEGGELPLGGGLLAILRPALALARPGGVIALRSRARSVREDLPSFCRAERHTYLGVSLEPDGSDVHRLARGPFGAPPPEEDAHAPLALAPDGRATTAALLAAAPWPARADVHTGFAPRGARIEPGGPPYPFAVVERDRVAPPDTAQLYDQSVAAQWDAQRDIPWGTIRALPPALEHAIGQVMTFLAENELSALYVPARFLPRIHPAYVEVAQLLAAQLADEARHLDAFVKRARIAGGQPGISSVTTARSLRSLLEVEDFLEATFLLSVLGEGTFLDLLRFIERHAPDEATAELARRARTDEARHVHFGLSHVRHARAHDPGLPARLQAAVRKRAATLAGVSSVPAPIQDALTILAARGDDPPSVARGHEAFRALLLEMHEGRMKRLESAGFTADEARQLSELHTPNFM